MIRNVRRLSYEDTAQSFAQDASLYAGQLPFNSWKGMVSNAIVFSYSQILVTMPMFYDEEDAFSTKLT